MYFYNFMSFSTYKISTTKKYNSSNIDILYYWIMANRDRINFKQLLNLNDVYISKGVNN